VAYPKAELIRESGVKKDQFRSALCLVDSCLGLKLFSHSFDQLGVKLGNQHVVPAAEKIFAEFKVRCALCGYNKRSSVRS
jgi:hypothetical protein